MTDELAALTAALDDGARVVIFVVPEGARITVSTPTQRKGNNRKPAVALTPDNYFAALLPAQQTPAVEKAVAEWFDYRQRKKLVLTREAANRQIVQLRKLSGPDEVVRWITHAIDKQWRGLYAPTEHPRDKEAVAVEHEYERAVADIAKRIDGILAHPMFSADGKRKALGELRGSVWMSYRDLPAPGIKGAWDAAYKQATGGGA